MFYAYGMSITLRYADSREQAVEILNDAFLKVLNNVNKYDLKRPFRPWLRQIIINTAINQFHKNRRDPQWVELSHNGDSLSRDETIISSISYTEIITLVQQLPPSYRTVFNLHVIEGFRHEEIADMLGIAVGTSKSNLFKAKKVLRSKLEKHLYT